MKTGKLVNVFLTYVFLHMGMSASASMKVVTNTNDSGPGSFRETIALANKSDSIGFASSIHGDTIRLTSGQIALSKGITLIGDENNPMVISGNKNSRILEISQGENMVIANVEFIEGKVSGLNPGGAIANYGNLTLYQTRFRYNTADYGGALYCDTVGSIFLTRCELENNSAVVSGAGMYTQGVAIISESTFAFNVTLSKDGGALFNSGGYVELMNSTISDNQAFAFGGGIYNRGEILLNHCTFSSNRADKGGGILNEFLRGELSGSHNIIAGNSANQGPDIYDPTGTDVISLGHNLVGDVSYLTNAFGTETDIYGAYGVVIDPKLEPLAYNGGFGKTRALQCFSPAVNHGSTSSTFFYDQAGQNRIYGPRMDIGAYELQQDSCTIAVGIGNVAVADDLSVAIYPNPATDRIWIDFNDLSASAGVQASLRTMNGQIVVYPEDFAVDASGLLISPSLSKLASGNYILDLTSAAGHLSNVVIIND